MCYLISYVCKAELCHYLQRLEVWEVKCASIHCVTAVLSKMI